MGRVISWYLPLLFLVFSCTLATFAILTAFWDPTGVGDDCNREQLACGVGQDLVAASLVAAVGYFLLFYDKRNKLLNQYLKRARERPAHLLDGRPKDQEAALLLSGRNRTREHVIRILQESQRPDPVIIVGDSGVGKTALLAAITERLAKRRGSRLARRPTGRVPIPVSLRGAKHLDFEDLARRNFVREIDAELNSKEQGDAIWRKLQRSLGIIVLADGLEQVIQPSKPARDAAVIRAIQAARERNVGVVLSARPHAAPDLSEAVMLPLEPLDRDELREYVLARFNGEGNGSPVSADIEVETRAREVVTKLVQAAGPEMIRIPYYLDIVVDVYRERNLDDLPYDRPWAFQVALLGRYVESKIAARQASEMLTEERAQWMLSTLEREAPSMLCGGGARLVGALDRDDAPEWGADLTVKTAVMDALDLPLLERRPSSKLVRFSHPIMHSYFAARGFRRAEERSDPSVAPPDGGDEATSWREVLSSTTSDETLRALAMFAATGEPGSKAKQRARSVCSQLIRMAQESEPNKALRLARTAADIASAAGLSDLGQSITEAACQRDADRGEKIRTVRSLSAMRQVEGYRGLLMHARGEGLVPVRFGDFAVRWVASRELIAAGYEAYRALEGELDALLEDAESCLGLGQRSQRERELAVFGWLLPGLRHEVAAKSGREVEVRLERMLRLALAQPFDPTGIENSLARGFKIAALRDPSAPADPLARDFLPKARFWHSRLSLLHAVAIPSFHPAEADEMTIDCLEMLSGEDRDTVVRGKRRRATSGHGDPHPFVREAAGLCLFGILLRNPYERYIWEAEGHATSQSDPSLSGGTLQLVADVAILLNLIYSRIAETPDPERRVSDAVLRQLPPCLSTSSDRSELFEGCPETCQAELCPFPARSIRAAARGELSRRFCELQSELVLKGRRPPWQDSIKARDLDAFWERMADEAAAKGPVLQWWEPMGGKGEGRAAVPAGKLS